MSFVRTILSAFLVPTVLTAWGAAQGAEEPRGMQAKPGQAAERPFGGPPNRSLDRLGKRCATRSRTCLLEQQGKVGADCLCPGEDGQKVQGQIVQ